MLPMRPSTRSWLALLLLGTLLGGCDATIDPYSDRFSYSVYGFLAPFQDAQFFRVRPLDEPLLSTTSRLDLTVTLENRSTGETTTLTDSVIVYRDENTRVTTHNYWTSTAISRNTEYRLTLEGPDDTTVQSTVKTLPKIEPNVTPKQGPCRTVFAVELPGIENQRQIRRATVELSGLRVQLSERNVGSNGRITFEPAHLIRTSQSLPSGIENPCSTLNSNQVTLRTSYFSEVPPQYARFLNPAQPLELPDVRDGRGFVGALGQSEVTVEVDTSEGDSPR